MIEIKNSLIRIVFFACLLISFIQSLHACTVEAHVYAISLITLYNRNRFRANGENFQTNEL